MSLASRERWRPTTTAAGTTGLEADRTAGETTRSRFGAVAAYVSLAAVAALPRSLLLMREDLRLDETFTAWVATRELTAIPGLIARVDTHPPLHYLLVGLVPGHVSPVALRLLSVLAGVATVLLVADLARRLVSRWAPRGTRPAFLVAGAAAAVTPMLVAISRIGRMYALAGLLVLVTVGATLVWLDVRRPGHAVAGGTIAALAMLTHVSAIPPVLTVVGLVAGREACRRGWRPAGLLVAPVLVLWGPWVPGLVLQLRHAGRNLSWMGPPSWQRTLDGVGGGWWRWGAGEAVVVALAMLVAATAVVAWRRRSFHLAVVAAATVAALGVPVVASSVVQSLPLPRSIAVGAPLVAVLFGVVVASLPGWRWTVAVAVVVSVAAVTWPINARTVTAVTVNAYEEATAALAAAVGPDDAVLYVGSYTQLPFEWYEPELSRATVRGIPTTFTRQPQWEAHVRPEDAATVRAVARTHDVVHHVQMRSEQLDPTGVVARTLAETHDAVDEQRFRGLTVTRWERDLAVQRDGPPPRAARRADGA